MKTYYRLIFLSGIFTLSVFGVSKFCKKATGGFTELSVIYPIETGTQDLPSSLCHLYDQKFYYLAKGAQSFAFISEDQKTVIKFLRFDHLLPKWSIRALSFINHPYIQKRMERSQREIKDLLMSFDFAANHLNQFTYLSHFQKKPMKRPLTIIDKIGVTHYIKNAPFIVQAYAPSIESQLDQLDDTTLKSIIDQAIDITSFRMQKGFIDTDPNLVTNFGLFNGKLVQFDIGRFEESKTPFTHQQTLDEIKHVFNFLWPEIKTKFPHLKTYFEHKLYSINKDYEAKQ